MDIEEHKFLYCCLSKLLQVCLLLGQCNLDSYLHRILKYYLQICLLQQNISVRKKQLMDQRNKEKDRIECKFLLC